MPVTGTRAVGRAMERAFEPRRFVYRMILFRLVGCAVGLAILAFAALAVLGILGGSLLHR